MVVISMVVVVVVVVGTMNGWAWLHGSRVRLCALGRRHRSHGWTTLVQYRVSGLFVAFLFLPPSLDRKLAVRDQS